MHVGVGLFIGHLPDEGTETVGGDGKPDPFDAVGNEIRKRGISGVYFVVTEWNEGTIFCVKFVV